MFEERPDNPIPRTSEQLAYVPDPAVEHLVTIEREDTAQLGCKRVTCTCGFDTGWRTPIVAMRETAFHRDRVLAGMLLQQLGDLPVPLIERAHERESQFRWCCDRCPAVGKWVPSEVVACVGSILHVEVCPRTGGR